MSIHVGSVREIGRRGLVLLLAVVALSGRVCAGESGSLPSSRPAGMVADGTPAATPFYVQDSGKPGPVVMIVGGAHGDEPAGAYAAEQIRHWPIIAGKIIVLPRANVAALAAKKRLTPGLDADVSNLNRDYPSASGPATAHGALAESIWSLARQQKPEWLLDLHEGVEVGNGSVGDSVIACADAATKEMAQAMLAAVNSSFPEDGRKFALRSPPVDGSLARAAGHHLKAHAMILETTRKDQALSTRARQHRILVHTFLKRLNMIPEEVTPEWITDHAAATQLKVAVYDASGSAGAGVPRTNDILGALQDVVVEQVGPEDLSKGVLSQFQVIMFTGGSGGRQARSIGPEGHAAVKAFVENGGGYVGICAGAYLACSGFSWGLGILNAKTVSAQWQRGHGTVKIELTAKGRDILGDKPGLLDVRYANGPIITGDNAAALPKYEPLAVFRTELSEHGSPVGAMVNAPAIVAAECGKGRVITISPHPEQSDGLGDFIVRAVRWTARRTEQKDN